MNLTLKLHSAQNLLTKTLLLGTLILGTLGMPVTARAQDNVVISPQSIVVNPKPAFGVEVSVDKDASGDATPSYQIGETVTISVKVAEAAYVYLFNVRSNGEIQQILPNRYDDAGKNNYVQAGQTKVFPAPNAPYTFSIEGPQGLDKVIAVASKEPLDTSTLADFGQDPNFASSRQSEQSFAQSLSIVVTPKPQNSWVTDTALLYVGSAPATPVYGTLTITSNPSGAAAYVDGQFVGTTPVRFGTRAGTHTVRLELSGYAPYSTDVTLEGGQSLPVPLSLSGSAPQPQSVAVTPAPAPAAPQPQPVTVTAGTLSDSLGLNLYPGASLRKLEQDGGKIKAQFETGASLQQVYDDLHGQLTALGWQRTLLQTKDTATKFEADYARNGQGLDLKLDQEGKSGKYKLELKF